MKFVFIFLLLTAASAAFHETIPRLLAEDEPEDFADTDINPNNVCQATNEAGYQSIELQWACLCWGAYRGHTGFALGWRELTPLDVPHANAMMRRSRKAYVAVNDEQRQCAIIFQGTKTPQDLVYDADVAPTEVDFWPGQDNPFKPPKKFGDDNETETDIDPAFEGGRKRYRVMNGFLNSLKDVMKSRHWPKWTSLIKPHIHAHMDGVNASAPEIQQALESSPCKNGLFIIGHSLGGAAASLHKLAHFGENSRAAKVIIFGSPKPVVDGFEDCDGVRYYITSKGANRGDPFPSLIPYWKHGHSGINLHIEKESDKISGLSVTAIDKPQCPQRLADQDECPAYITLYYSRHKMGFYAYLIWKIDMQKRAKKQTRNNFLETHEKSDTVSDFLVVQ